jgi:hypothetical protein
MPRYSRRAYSDYPELREVLAPQYRKLPAEDIEALLEGVNLSAVDFENYLEFWGDIGKAISQYAPSVLSGAVQGASSGAALGPYGMLGGAILGGVGGGLSKGMGQTQAPPSPQMPSSGMPPGQTPQMPMQQMPIPGNAPAAGTLLQILSRPEVIQALTSMLLGQLGRSNVPVGSKPVPVGAFPNLVGTLANQAQAEYHAANISTHEGLPEYLRDYAGEAIGDPAVAEHRAQALYELLQEADVEQVIPRRSTRRHATVSAESFDEDEAYDEAAFYNELELAEFYSEADE